MKRTVVFTAGLAVLVYAVVVVWYASRTPDIGLRCAFKAEVQHVNEQSIRFPADASDRPRVGDELKRLGSKDLKIWSDFVRTLAALHDKDLYPRKPVAPNASLAELLVTGGPDFIHRDGEDLVRVEFRHLEEEKIRACWCVIGRPPATELAPSLLWFFVKIGLFVTGAIVYWKRPGDAGAQRFFLLCTVTVGAFMGGYHWWRIAAEPPLIIVFMICAVLLPVVSLHFYLLFPAPKPFVARHPKAAIAAVYGVPGLFLLAMLATYAVVVWTYRSSEYPVSVVETWLTSLKYEIYAYLGVAGLLFFGCVASLWHGYVTTRPGSLERNQVKWIMAGALLATIPVGYTLILAIIDTDSFGVGGATWPMFAASLCITIAYGISISRYGLMEVGKVVNWGIIYFGVSVAAGLVCFVMFFLGTLLIGSQPQLPSPIAQAAVVSTVLLLLLIVLDLVRWRLRQAMDRRLHRAKYQLDKTLERMSHAVEQLVDPPTLCRRFLQSLADLLGFQQGAVYLRTGSPTVYRLVTQVGKEPPLTELPPGSPLVDGLGKSPVIRVRTEFGAPVEPAQRQLALLAGEIAVPLRHEGSLLAVLVAGRRALGGYEVEELHLLTTFSQVAALALHGARGHRTIDTLNRELQTKVEKISEQQRRILVLQSQLLRQGTPSAAAPAAAAIPGNGTPRELATGGMVGSSRAVQHLLQIVRKVSASPSAVLIRGESGTGKELLARALHDNSARAGKAFVKVHCAALSPTLLESELFGHVKGAFTGAHRDKVGRFEMANGGTLFLDEIGDITLEVQTKLLRVLQEMTFERVGSSDPVQVDVRLVAATNQHLEELMKQGRFREDLFYRLNVITIRTPPLRERRDDIYELALYFLKTYSQRSGKSITHIEDEALEILKAHDWPGNIRELENLIERAVVLADGSTITIQELPEELFKPGDRAYTPHNGAEPPAGFDLGVPEGEWLARHEEHERERLVHALASAAGNKARAARTLGVPRSTLLSKLKKYGLS